MLAPYVYKAKHKASGKFYIGYRSNHIQSGIPIWDDLGKKYFSSSSTILENVDQYDFTVLVVCNSKDYAYETEQRLIAAYWNDPLLINKHCIDVDTAVGHFRCNGHTAETRNKISVNMTGIKRSAETKRKMKEACARRDRSHYTGGNLGARKGQRWATDGVSNIRCYEHELPAGWRVGRTLAFHKYK